MADLNKLVDQLSELTVLEAADLSKLLEEKWGVSAAAAVAAPARDRQNTRRVARTTGHRGSLGVVHRLDSGLGDAVVVSW